jgi:putative methyltransferase (TIGR04325 family)
MKSQLKNLLRDLTPPLLWRAAWKIAHPAPATPVPTEAPAEPAPRQYGASGDYASYAEALEACGGSYHNKLVQEKTRSLTAAIKAGPEISQLNIRLLAALQYAAARLPGPLDVLDFGGAMGAHYFYLRSFFEQIAKWTVVEIEETVAMGNEHFADGKLSFETQISGVAPIILTSGAIQYTDDPHGSLARLLERGARFVVLDKIPMLDRDRRTVQYIHPSVFGAEVAFPSYFFDEAKFRSRFAPYRIVMEWELPGYAAHLDGQYLEINRGFLLEHPAPISQ